MIDITNKHEVADALRALADAVENDDAVVTRFSWSHQSYEPLSPGQIELHASQVFKARSDVREIPITLKITDEEDFRAGD